MESPREEPLKTLSRRSFLARLMGWLVAAGVIWLLVAERLALALVVPSAGGPADAVMLLAGSAVQTERVGKAAELLLSQRAPVVLITNDGTRGGWSRRRQARIMMVDRTSDGLVDAGVDESRIVRLPGMVRSTHDEALALRNYLQSHALSSVLVVTSGYHSRRALWVFRRVLADVDVRVDIAAVPPGWQTPSPDRWWLSRRGWLSVGLEYVKLGFYRLRY